MTLAISKLQLAPESSPADDFSFDHGAINVVLGRNLSGKTPLCRFLCGLPTPATGEMMINGRQLHDPKERMIRAALVYQAFVNYPNWTVRDNIASPLKAVGVPGREIEERVSRLAGKVRIEGLLNRKPDELSGGQQQRLAIARALAKDPELLVMDEPFVNIDYKLREELEDELRDLIAGTETCLIYTTSDPRDALSLADRLLLLQDSKVMQHGRPLDLYRNPSSLAAADLLSDPGVNLLRSNQAVRPEHVHLEPGEGVELESTITGVETNGAETYVHADVTPEGEITREWVIKLRGMRQISPGEKKRLFVNQEDLLEFPAEVASDHG